MNSIRAVALIAGVAAAHAAPARAQQVHNAELRQRLLGLVAEGTAKRRILLPEMAGGGAVMRRADDSVVVKLRALDSTMTVAIREIIATHGWPGASLVGADGSHAAFLLVQQSRDFAFKKKALELLTRAAASGDAAQVDLAYLGDAVSAGLGQPQRYGTALHFANNRMEPSAIEDSANVDARRRKIGLGPLADSVQSIKIIGMPADAKRIP
ncbi:MAG: hypothetical protein JWM95_2385 [Gemmatimonadetes bacterium]|nr:hypothetical protein [Gemmatimonadota bacterium]